MSRKRSSVAEHNAAIRERSSAVASQVAKQESWLERTLKPKKVNARYPVKGSSLLYATCAFGSLGDALFGYNSGKIYISLERHSVNASQVSCPDCWSTRCLSPVFTKTMEVPTAPRLRSTLLSQVYLWPAFNYLQP